MEKFENNNDYAQKERIENFKEFVNEVQKEIYDEVEKEKKFEADLNKKAIIRNGLMNKIWWTITEKLLGMFKVKITLYYHDKIIFEYVIPKEK